MAPASSVHLTTDGGTSAAVKKYQAVTAHWLDHDLKVQELVVAIVNMKNAANQANLETVLDGVIDRFGLAGKDLTIITDNASNITATTASMTRAGKIFEGLRCTAHTLQLAVREVLEEEQFKTFLDKIRGRLNTMRKSAACVEMVEVHQREAIAAKKKTQEAQGNLSKSDAVQKPEMQSVLGA